MSKEAVNIAIIIGVSEYDKLDDLPSCVANAHYLQELLASTGKYSAIRIITKQSESVRLKDEVRLFLKQYGGKRVGEIFFYFSGYGVFKGEDVLFCCSDFNERMIQTTCLSNGELDELLSDLAADFVVKIIDLCDKGPRDMNDIYEGHEKSFRKSLEMIKKVFCMISCKSDRLMFEEKRASHFTDVFIKGALRKREGTVFYRDIRSYIEDFFMKDAGPGLFFISKGAGACEFSSINNDMVLLGDRKDFSYESFTNKVDMVDELREIIENNDRSFVSDLEVEKFFKEARSVIEQNPVSDSVVISFYDIKVDFERTLGDLAGQDILAKWMADKGYDQRFLMKLEYDESGTIPVGFSALHKLPFEIIRARFIPKNPSLVTYELIIGLLHSKTEIMALEIFVKMAKSDWNSGPFDKSKFKWEHDIVSWALLIDSPVLWWKSHFERAVTEIRESLELLRLKKNKEYISEREAPVIETVDDEIVDEDEIEDEVSVEDEELPESPEVEDVEKNTSESKPLGDLERALEELKSKNFDIKDMEDEIVDDSDNDNEQQETSSALSDALEKLRAKKVSLDEDDGFEINSEDIEEAEEEVEEEIEEEAPPEIYESSDKTRELKSALDELRASRNMDDVYDISKEKLNANDDKQEKSKSTDLADALAALKEKRAAIGKK